MSSGQSSTIHRLQVAFEDARKASARKDRFIAVAAHELRQPLAALMLQAESLRRMGLRREDELLEELGTDLRATVRRQARLICDLVDVVRVRTGRLQLCPEDVEVGTVVRRVVTAMAMAKPSIHLRIDIGPAETLVCRVDSIRVEQIVSNLMENALKCAGPAGRIDVRVVADADFAQISIADNGRGFEHDAIDTLFQAIDRTQDNAAEPDAGMGIGLSLVRELADAQGGHLRAYSAGSGQGAEFTVWLPLSKRGNAEEIPLAHDQGIQATDGRNCLNIGVGTPAGSSP